MKTDLRHDVGREARAQPYTGKDDAVGATAFRDGKPPFDELAGRRIHRRFTRAERQANCDEQRYGNSKAWRYRSRESRKEGPPDTRECKKTPRAELARQHPSRNLEPCIADKKCTEDPAKARIAYGELAADGNAGYRDVGAIEKGDRAQHSKPDDKQIAKRQPDSVLHSAIDSLRDLIERGAVDLVAEAGLSGRVDVAFDIGPELVVEVWMIGQLRRIWNLEPRGVRQRELEMEVHGQVKRVAPVVRRALKPERIGKQPDTHGTGDAADVIGDQTRDIERAFADVFGKIGDGVEELTYV